MVCRPKSLAEFEPVWSALWNTLGQAIEKMSDEQSGEVNSPASTTKGCGIPSIIAPGQNEKVMLMPMERILPDEDQEMVSSTRVRVGVSHGSGRRPFEKSSGVYSSNRWSHDA